MNPLLLPSLLLSPIFVSTSTQELAARTPLDSGPVTNLVLGPDVAAAHLGGGVRRLTVKFVDAARVRPSARDGVVSLSGVRLDEVRTLAATEGLNFSPLIQLPQATLDALVQRAADRSRVAQPDLAGMLIVHAPTQDPEALADLGERLRGLPEVEYAYLEILGTPPPGDIAPPTPDHTALQTYVPADPGLDASYAHGRGYTGSGVRLSDCEYGWNPNHEDFCGIALNLEPGQTLDPQVFSLGFDSHGTAVIGSSSAVDNAYGVTGIAHQSSVHTFPEWTVEQGFRRATCIANAIAGSAAGDVVLLEMQANGAGGGFGPAELDPNVFTIVKAGSDAGVVVVAAAGNGNQNLDGAAYASYRNLGDSGAILIGAGTADAFHEKLSFSTYGSRVNVQGWGQLVFTLGYGDFAAYGGDKNQRYTASFSGTSSASGLSAPAVCLLQEAATATLGARLSPLALRQLLIDTGIPQGAGGHIGPFIDLRAAIEAIDALASFVVRNGTGANPAVYASTSLPILGTTWTAEVDATGHPGAGMTLILGYSAPLAPTPSSFGEMLIDLGATFQFRSRSNSGGGIALHANPIPNDISLIGVMSYTQAGILGGFVELTNAVDLRLGN